jgi:hypothetical protein
MKLGEDYSMSEIEPPEIRVTTTQVKEHVLQKAIRFMVMAGLLVQENRVDKTTTTITVTIPPEVQDKHGERFKKMRDAKTA